MPSPNAVHAKLHSMSLATLSAKSHILSLKATQTVEEAVDLFAKEKIHSAPVMGKDGEVLGYVDMLDIVWSIMKCAPSPVPDWNTASKSDLAALKMFGRAIAWEELANVVNASGREPLDQLFEKDPASRAAALFGQGALRVPIFDHSFNVVNTVSQSAVLAAIHKDIEVGDVGHFSAVSIKELGLLGNAANKVATVNKKESVFKVIQALKAADVHAIAVVDDAGVLVGNFSATDLASVVKERLPHLTDSIEHYLTEHSAGSLKPVTVQADGNTSFREVVHILVEHHISRVWVVNADGKPVDVISGTDICRLVNTRTYPN